MADQPSQDPNTNPALIQVDESSASTVYANFCRVNMTPEEIVMSFGLNTQVQITEPIKTSHRLVMNFYTAKRLLNALQFAVQRHESFFGVVEVDVQKRVRGFPQQTGIRPMGQ